VRPLTAGEVLEVWERGERQAPAEQALVLLGAALPGTPRRALADLSIGERDACLLALRERTLGSALRGRTACPACTARLEFTVATEDIYVAADAPPAAPELALAALGHELRYRLPTSRDLAAVAATCRSAEEGRALLLARCLLEARRDGSQVEAAELPEPVVLALAAGMAEHDPQAEVELRLACAACGRRWSVFLDIVDFFWTELAALADRLVQDVHTLARAYGWREADILALSSVRRRAYVEMLTE
jgi:hypothetical protein